MSSHQLGLTATLRAASPYERKALLATLDLSSIDEWMPLWCEADKMPDVRAFVTNKSLAIAKTVEEYVSIAESVRDRAQRRACRKIFKLLIENDRDIELLMYSRCRRLRLFGHRLAHEKGVGNTVSH